MICTLYLPVSDHQFCTVSSLDSKLIIFINCSCQNETLFCWSLFFFFLLSCRQILWFSRKDLKHSRIFVGSTRKFDRKNNKPVLYFKILLFPNDFFAFLSVFFFYSFSVLLMFFLFVQIIWAVVIFLQKTRPIFLHCFFISLTRHISFSSTVLMIEIIL